MRFLTGRSRWTLLAAGILAMAFWGCGDDDSRSTTTPTSGDGMGLLNVRLGTDGSPESPRTTVRNAGRGEIQGLLVTVSSAAALPVCPMDSVCAPVELLEAPVTVDLLQLEGEITVDLSSCDLPVGDYTGIAATVDTAVLVLADSTEMGLPICEGANPILVEMAFTITEDMPTQITIKLHHDSVLSPDGAGSYLFCPDLRGDDDSDGDGEGDDDSEGEGEGDGDGDDDGDDDGDSEGEGEGEGADDGDGEGDDEESDGHTDADEDDSDSDDDSSDDARYQES